MPPGIADCEGPPRAKRVGGASPNPARAAFRRRAAPPVGRIIFDAGDTGYADSTFFLPGLPDYKKTTAATFAMQLGVMVCDGEVCPIAEWAAHEPSRRADPDRCTH